MLHHPLEDIPELANLDGGSGLVRIPVQQDVPFTPRVRALVDTAEFQRLGHVTQLGLVSRVYPGATHTRFEHALGVFRNVLRYLWQLGKDSRFQEIVDPHQAEVLMAAALLHDLGHWPFCHPIEDMALPDLPPHEQFAAEFLSPDAELSQVLLTDWGVQPQEMLRVLTDAEDPPEPVSPALPLSRSILSGPIDVDKMDYLDRDSLHAGVPYGRNFDKNRLIQSLLLNEAGDGLAVSSKGRTAAEMMVFARYVMFSEVYWHHAVRSATSMFARAFYHLHGRFDLRTLFRQRESEMIRALRERAQGTDCQPLLEGIFGPKRLLYKRVAEFSLHQRPEMYQRLARQPYGVLVRCAEAFAERLARELDEDVAATEVLIDAPPPNREVEFKVDIYYPKENVYYPLERVSPVVASLAHTQFDDAVKRVRIFADPRRHRRIAECPRFLDCLQIAAAETCGE